MGFVNGAFQVGTGSGKSVTVRWSSNVLIPPASVEAVELKLMLIVEIEAAEVPGAVGTLGFVTSGDGEGDGLAPGEIDGEGEGLALG